jgi:secreted trypsin-like serine protease
LGNEKFTDLMGLLTANLSLFKQGTTSFAGPSSNVLLETNLRVISNTQCSTNLGQNIDVTKICTYGNKTRDTCGKDSGGGLYWTAGRKYVIATVNYGVYCASSSPAVNSRIDRYFSWIQDTTKAFFCRK